MQALDIFRAGSTNDYQSGGLMRLLIFCLFSLVAASQAWAAGDADAGKNLAQKWCANCHAVGPSGDRASDAAPPFDLIAKRHSKDESWLRAWLRSPHPSMPNFDLSNKQIDDVIAYLKTFPGDGADRP
jgi:mono/diheme cytochrome c family protein